MKRLFPILLLLGHCWATVSQTQHVCNNACAANSSTCNITVASTGINHLGVVTLINDSGTVDASISSVTGAGTWTHCSNCHATVGNSSGDAAYNLATTSGVTTIVVNLSASPTSGWTSCFHELSTTLSGFALDTGATPSCSSTLSASASPASCSLTLSGATVVIVTSLTSQIGTITGVSAPYGNSLQPSGNGSADNENITAGTGASWTHTGNITGDTVSIAFSQTSSAVTMQKRKHSGWM